ESAQELIECGALLERRMFARDWLAEVLAEGEAGTHHRKVSKGAPSPCAASVAHLQIGLRQSKHRFIRDRVIAFPRD
ncbi:MAG: hypothetical protein PVH66_02255, partial [Methyloceanibacter sp.]